MKLTKKEIEKVAEEFDLGEVISVKYLEGGMINYIFTFKTNKGNFIVRKLGYKLNDWWKLKKELEFSVLEFLKKEKFSYPIPLFIKNKKGGYILKIGKNLFEVYPMMNGKIVSKLNQKQLMEAIKALALYHKKIKNYGPKNKFMMSDRLNWILSEYGKMRENKTNNNLNGLMLENLTFFEDLLKKLIKIKFTTNLLVTHADFGRHNILWEKNKITGILDFENVSYRPKSFDISILLRKLISNKQRKLAVNRYRKFNPLSKKEENQIIILRLIHLCSIFKWIYQDMDKRPDLKEKFFIETITETKRLAKQLESSNSTN